jgi:hypothetical protein
MKKLIAAATALAVVAGGAGYGLAQSGGDEANAQDHQRKHAVAEPAAPKSDDRPTYRGEPVYPGPTVNLTWIDITIQTVEIGWSDTEVVTLLGEPDWYEDQSTDFGDDVILWYGEWAVYTSDSYVTSITWYG